MSIILESDIIDAYVQGEISEHDVVDLYTEGYISDNTMELLISEDKYISEAAEYATAESEALEEGRISRGVRAIGHKLAQSNRKMALRYHAAAALRDTMQGKSDKAIKHGEKVTQLTDKLADANKKYLRRQAADARLSKHTSAYEKFKNRLDQLNKQS